MIYIYSPSVTLENAFHLMLTKLSCPKTQQGRTNKEWIERREKGEAEGTEGNKVDNRIRQSKLYFAPSPEMTSLSLFSLLLSRQPAASLTLPSAMGASSMHSGTSSCMKLGMT